MTDFLSLQTSALALFYLMCHYTIPSSFLARFFFLHGIQPLVFHLEKVGQFSSFCFMLAKAILGLLSSLSRKNEALSRPQQAKQQYDFYSKKVSSKILHTQKSNCLTYKEVLLSGNAKVDYYCLNRTSRGYQYSVFSSPNWELRGFLRNNPKQNHVVMLEEFVCDTTESPVEFLARTEHNFNEGRADQYLTMPQDVFLHRRKFLSQSQARSQQTFLRTINMLIFEPVPAE